MFTKNPDFKYQRVYKKISAYTTTYNLMEGYPFVPAIKSALGFADEVVVVDGCSTDGTYEKLEQLASQDPRIKLYQNPWDMTEPGMDGMQKAFARALCEHEFLWQFDCDEIVHENDYEKVKTITKRFPQCDILHLPVVELWGNEAYATGRRHSWKWRMTRNKPEITHGINKHARVVDEKTGRVYAKAGMSDGCEYINVMTNDFLPHVGFYNQEFENARINDPKKYAEMMNQVYKQLPSVWHTSWMSLENKVHNFRTKWNRQWNALYMTQGVERFPGVDSPYDIANLSNKLYSQGGEDEDQVKYKFRLDMNAPKLLVDWMIENNIKTNQ